MKTKIITITAVLAAMAVVPMVFAQDDAGGRRVRQGIERPASDEQVPPLLEDLTPGQRQRVREFVQNRLQQQRQRLLAQMRDENPARPDRVQAQRDFPERGRAQMQRPFRGGGRMEGRFEGRGPRECPCCGRPMAQGERRPFGRQGFEGRGGYGPQARPFPGQEWQRPQRDEAERPAVRPRFEERGMGMGQGRGWMRTEPEDEQLGQGLEDRQARPRLRRNAQ